MSNFQSRYVNVKCNMSRAHVKPEDVAEFVENTWPGTSVLWAVHDEPGKELHFHMVIRFLHPTRWGRLRDFLSELDQHHYSQPARAFTRSVRYLLHLDNPEKHPIPRNSLKVAHVDDSELSMLLGAPRSCILADIRNLGQRGTFSAFDWLVNERGHSPNEVAQVLRCLGTIADWVQKVKSDESILDSADELGIQPEFDTDENPFPDEAPSSEFDFQTCP